MGFNRHSLNILLSLENYGVKKPNFSEIVTIGRQGLHEPENVLNSLFEQYKITVNGREYCEDFLKALGSEKVDSIDFSDYENCTILHDMNLEISDKLKFKYSLVIDSGTSEHIFNFPVSIKNCMDLVQENGHFIGIYPIDNFCGHGFYQFSPELFFRTFSSENGFEIDKMFMYQEKGKLNLYEIVDPEKLKRRNYFNTSRKTMVFFIAKKTNSNEAFKKFPQQSDYSLRWSHEQLTNRKFSKSNFVDYLRKLIPINIKRSLRMFLNRNLLFFRGVGIFDKAGIRKLF